MWREADADDLVGLTDLERVANLAALRHVFPPERYPFPEDDVLARWRLVLDDPSATVLVADDPDSDELIAFAAFDDTTLRHLAVRPDHWGQGMATAAIGTALHAMHLRGSTQASLWCLQENHRARTLYEHLHWVPTEDVREAPWPPHPMEMRYTRRVVPR
ncbi:MAG TPA: GNAT family N-acetyltransferase [Nocardioidaceae bacterium]|nr:GNAT family N-acetyltransferase [Nocardioidaceae bacterium]